MFFPGDLPPAETALTPGWRVAPSGSRAGFGLRLEWMEIELVYNHCKDCVAEGIITVRVMATDRNGKVVPGPRCVTHQRQLKKKRSQAAHAKRTESVYGITEAEYWAIYEAQGRCCAICKKATGTVRRLAVDHNHETGKVRGLLCKTCNYVVLGRYTAEALQRAIDYLRTEPAQQYLADIRRLDEES